MGIPLGALLIRQAGDEDAEFSGSGDEDSEELLRLGARVLGVAFVGGGGPVGAFQRLEGGGPKGYLAAVVGDLIGCAAGASASRLGKSQQGETIWGFAAGVPLAAIGSAVGAAFGAEENPTRTSAVLQSGPQGLSAGPPSIRVQPPAGPGKSLSVTVSLVEVDLQGERLNSP